MSRLYVVESGTSATGAKADHRSPMPLPSCEIELACPPGSQFLAKLRPRAVGRAEEVSDADGHDLQAIVDRAS